MTTNNKPYDNQKVIDELLNLYRDYEKKRIRHFPIMDCVRDLYYLEHTSLTFKEWCEARDKKEAEG